jgi:hypothetical protein
MMKTEIPKKKGTGLAGLFGGKGKKTQQKGMSLFGAKKEEDQASTFYGGEEDEGDSFNSSFYSGKKEAEEVSEDGAPKWYGRLAFFKYLSVLEYFVVAVELFLIIYTILVLLNIAPMF